MRSRRSLTDSRRRYSTTREPSLRDKLSYELDRWLSWHVIARFIVLAFAALLITSTCAILLTLMDGVPIVQSFWWCLERVMNSSFTAEESTVRTAIGFLCALAGTVVVASLIGLVSNTMQEQFDSLRKGKSRVLVQGHTLILGYQREKVHSILQELSLRADLIERDHVAVILSTEEKEAIEAQISEMITTTKRFQVVVRSGYPWNPDDLRKVSAGAAASIIILNPDLVRRLQRGDVTATADMAPIKAILGLMRVPGALQDNHAVIEFNNNHRIPVLKDIVGSGRFESVLVRELLAKIMVQTSRQPGLAEVYANLMHFGSANLCSVDAGPLIGLRFNQLQLRVYSAAVCGLIHAEKNEGGRLVEKVSVNPPGDTVVGDGDKVILLAPLAQFPRGFSFGPARALDASNIKSSLPKVATRQPERFLICGYHENIDFLLLNFDAYVAEGSEVFVIPATDEKEFFDLIPSGGSFKNLTVRYQSGDPTLPAPLEALKQKEPPNCILVFADSRVPETEADAKTIITVLLLRQLYSGMGQRPRVICELLDQKSTELLDKDVGCEFVLSTDLTSRQSAQVSHNSNLSAVFEDFFDPEGSELSLKSAVFYCFGMGIATRWLVTQQIAAAMDEDAEISYHRGDRVILISEDDREYVAAL